MAGTPSPVTTPVLPGNAVSIAAVCPHCETRFNLQPEMLGKSMRCPNPDCREVFEVRDAAPPPAAPTPAAPPRTDRSKTRSGAVGDFVPVVEAEVVAPAKRKPAPKPRPAPPPDVEVVDAVVVAPATAKEVVWTPDADLPPGPPPARSTRDEVATPGRRRRRKASRAPLVLAGLGILTVLTAGAGGLYYVRYLRLTEERLATQADEEYKAARYAEAKRAYEKLAADYPSGDQVEKYRFFAELAALQADARSVTNVENPRPAVEKLRAFAAARKDSPFAKPGESGRDVFDLGKKLGEDVVQYARNRVAAYTADRSKADELQLAEEAIAAGRDLPPLVDPFRGKDTLPLAVAAELDKVKADVDRERHRLAVIGRVKKELFADPSDAVIQAAKVEFRANGLADDAEARGLIDRAETDFLRRIRYDRDPAAPQPPPPAAASLLFVAPVGPTRPAGRGPQDPPPTVFLAIARGVLYALDEDTGDLLWAARVGPDAHDPPTLVRVESADGPTDLAVATANVGGQPAVAGLVPRTGRPLWWQPLPAPAAGPAAVVGTRAFVPVRDPAGSVLVFDLTTGTRVGRITLGQPVAHAVPRPETGELYLAGEARRVFVFDLAAADSDGARPRCTRVIPTGHPAGTLRTPPVVLGPPGADPATRWLVLSQADGPSAMKLRAFPLPPPTRAADDGTDSPPVVDPIPPGAELPLPKWAWFPPAADGEQLAVVTDAGQFRVYGVNQPGNNDRAIFPLPHPELPLLPDDTPVPGLAVPAEEGGYWVLAGGSLQKFRQTLHPVHGPRMVPAGKPDPVGIPTQPAQLNARRDTACFVVRSPNSSGCRAVAVRLHDGGPRWQRQLGLLPSAGPVASGDGLLLVDEDGGAVRIPTGGLTPTGATKADPKWAVAASPGAATGTTAVAVSADGQTVYAVTPTNPGDGAKWVVRRVVNGAVERTVTVPAPAALAGSPAVLGDGLLLPAADGFVYRLPFGDGGNKPPALAPGPRWWNDRKHPDPVCFVVPVGGDRFLTSDGGRVLTRWEWPADGPVADGGARWDVRDRVAAAPVLLPAAGGRPARLLVADAAGGVWLYPADRGGAPVRRWVPGRTVSLPGGKVTGFGVQTTAAGGVLVCYAADGGRLVGLDPDRDDVKWVTGADDGGGAVGVPQPAGDGRWLVTDLSGRVRLLDGETGKTLATKDVAAAGAVPATAGVPAGDGRALVPLSDGSVTVVEVRGE